MKKVIFSNLLATLFLIFPWTTYAWNALGHMVVANIAYAQLTPIAKQKIDQLVVQLNQEYPAMETFMDMAYWPDTLRSQKIDLYTHWHYIDNPLTLDNTPIKHNIDTDNAVWAVNKILPIVKNDKANPYERARFLAFLTHIVADLHQPLHTTTLYSTSTPDGDKGGNLYRIKYKGYTTNLHKLWDKGVGIFEGERSAAHADRLTATIQSNYPEDYFGNLTTDMDPAHWAAEGVNDAKRYTYNTLFNQPVSTNYVERGQQIAEEKTALAGYRLGVLLNQLLDQSFSQRAR